MIRFYRLSNLPGTLFLPFCCICDHLRCRMVLIDACVDIQHDVAFASETENAQGRQPYPRRWPAGNSVQRFGIARCADQGQSHATRRASLPLPLLFRPIVHLVSQGPDFEHNSGVREGNVDISISGKLPFNHPCSTAIFARSHPTSLRYPNH